MFISGSQVIKATEAATDWVATCLELNDDRKVVVSFEVISGNYVVKPRGLADNENANIADITFATDMFLNTYCVVELLATTDGVALVRVDVNLFFSFLALVCL